MTDERYGWIRIFRDEDTGEEEVWEVGPKHKPGIIMPDLESPEERWELTDKATWEAAHDFHEAMNRQDEIVEAYQKAREQRPRTALPLLDSLREFMVEQGLLTQDHVSVMDDTQFIQATMNVIRQTLAREEERNAYRWALEQMGIQARTALEAYRAQFAPILLADSGPLVDAALGEFSNGVARLLPKGLRLRNTDTGQIATFQRDHFSWDLRVVFDDGTTTLWHLTQVEAAPKTPSERPEPKAD